MDRRNQLDKIRREIFENVYNMLEGTSEENTVPCYVTLETPGMDEEFCTHLEKIYRDDEYDEAIWCSDESGNVIDFDELDIYQMAQVEAELSDYFKK